jgi:hypothetical protein
MTKKIAKCSGKKVHEALSGSKMTASVVKHSMKSAINILTQWMDRVTAENCSEFEVATEQHKPVAPIEWNPNLVPTGSHVQSGPEKIIVTFTDNSGVGRIRGAK